MSKECRREFYDAYVMLAVFILTFVYYHFSANAEIENAKKSGDAEVTVLRAQLKKAEMKISSMEKDIEQKVIFIPNI